ncbi:hypothetical protein I302_105895 [Kwoniella bestiolae CBS 10118]|uniref:DUF6534 domain-containing protein n=1 Tax=Kwoniella bestiolae CBS 10118 TaxID=1296100 RepID=A0A1B9G2F7_9TREE|nr:hypothetical protein I302_05020 [Kwoniella bestiolae CBS 10118]OCF25207.1 hypothetical protein I302_05020 [Kwoniella bestiolae CBS 10118]
MSSPPSGSSPQGMPPPPSGGGGPPPGGSPPSGSPQGGTPMASEVVPLILGFAFDAIMMGIVIQQFLFWNTWARSTERRWIKVIIYWISAISLAVTIYSIWWMIHLVDNGLSSSGGSSIEAEYFANYFIFGVAVAFVAQCFFAERAYRINKRGIILLILVTPLILTSAAGAFGLSVVTRPNHQLSTNSIDIFFYLWTLCGVVADLILLLSIAYGLKTQKTGWTNTDSLVNRLIRLSFETQLPGTMIAIALFIQFIVNRGSPWHYFFTVIQPKVYTVGILAVLNARLSLRQHIQSSAGSQGKSKENSYKSSDAMHQATVDVSSKGADKWSSSDPTDKYSSVRDLNAPEEMELEDRSRAHYLEEDRSGIEDLEYTRAA